MKDKYLLSDPSLDSKSTSDLLAAVNEAGLLQRTRTWAALCRRVRTEPHLSEKVIQVIRSDEARSARLFGLVTMSHVLIACLWNFGDEDVCKKLQYIVSQWGDSADKEILSWYLTNEGIQITSSD